VQAEEKEGGNIGKEEAKHERREKTEVKDGDKIKIS